MNKRIILTTLIIIAICMLIGCTSPRPVPPSIEPQPAPEQVDPIAELIRNMTLEEKIGQMLIVGVEGTQISDKERLLLKDYHVGGFILFGKNIESPKQLLALTNSLKEANAVNNTPIFVSIDEEGGRINRFPKEIAGLPTSKAVGKQRDKDLAYEVGLRLAEKVRAFGINLNFAPVLDINSNPKNPVIGDRAFGSDAELVSSLGAESMEGIMAGGVIPVVKHFPGHGDTAVDSHKGLPVVDYDMNRLMTFELIPFANAIQKDAPCIMVAHILLSELDNTYPATLSPIIVNDILRKQLNFNGVVVTDDMTMGAITKNFNMEAAVLQAVMAGNDILLMAHEYKNAQLAFEVIRRAVMDKSITEERLNQSVYRILALKNKFYLQDNIVYDIDINKLNKKIKETNDKLK